MPRGSHVAAALLEAWNAHDVERIVAVHAPDCCLVDVAQAHRIRGHAALRTVIERYLRAFPDLHLHAGRPVVQEVRCAIFWTATGTHQGSLLHIPATGRRVTVRGSSLLILNGDLIAEQVVVWDVAGWLRAVGLLPDL